jgi:hypothetical protein
MSSLALATSVDDGYGLVQIHRVEHPGRSPDVLLVLGEKRGCQPAVPRIAEAAHVGQCAPNPAGPPDVRSVE